MIDYIKIHINNPRLIDIERIQGIQLTKFLNEYYLEIILKTYNRNSSNGDLSYPDLFSAIKNFCISYAINPFHYELRNIGYGVTVEPEMPPKRILEDVVQHKNKPFKRYRKGELECRYQRYRYMMNENGNKLGFAKRVNKMVHLQDCRIGSLTDLLIPKKLYQLGQDLLKSYDQTLILESVSATSLHSKERSFIQAIKTREHGGETDLISSRRRRRLMELINSHSSTRIKMGIRRLILKKINNLLSINMQMVEELADFLWAYPEYQCLQEESKFCTQFEKKKRRLIKDLKREANFSINEYVLGLHKYEEKLDVFDEILTLDTLRGIKNRGSGNQWVYGQEIPVYDEQGYLINFIKL